MSLPFISRWTRPCYGVSHLKQPSRRYHFTILENTDGSAYGYMVDRESDKAFTATRECYAVSVEVAKKQLEAWAKQLIAF
jgi:hypothetical protein